jgi:hypothetical protein
MLHCWNRSVKADCRDFAGEGTKDMQELDVTWSRALRVAWLVIWRTMLIAGVIGGLAGFVMGLGGQLAGLSRATISLAGLALGACIGYGSMIVAVRMGLRKRYREFRVALVPHDGN